MKEVYNFSAGPAMLPKPVLEKAAREMTNYKNSGMSVMEISHRSKLFKAILDEANALLRKLMNIPRNYHVLFLQGGASTQFAMVPLNLFGKSRQADFIHSGVWSDKAIQEAKKYGKVNVVASSIAQNFLAIPEWDERNFEKLADYFHITTNNTIEGTVFKSFPKPLFTPLVADMSSNILSEEIDVSNFGLIYAGAQKNIGPAGLTIVIIREDLIGHAMEQTPTMLNYQTHVENNSLYNTPPCYSIYMAKLVFEWLLEQGGLQIIAKTNQQKADLLYKVIDDSCFFTAPVAKEHRSIMNVVFRLNDLVLESNFLQESTAAGFLELKGHRNVGGCRASIYNAMPLEGVEKLAEFIKAFEKRY